MRLESWKLQENESYTAWMVKTFIRLLLIAEILTLVFVYGWGLLA
jgi:hypothetical protein